MRIVLKWIIISIAVIVISVFGLYCGLCIMSGAVIKYDMHNFFVESSPKYQQVIDDVMREVYTTFAKEYMESAEMWLSERDVIFDKKYYQEEKQKLEKAKELFDSNPEQAAELYMMLGSCHELWSLQKNILKERYGIIWYAPPEVYPNRIYD